MKRSAELTPLSHDHHQALFTAHRLIGAEDLRPSVALRAWWNGHGRRHFRIEEEVLLPAWREADPAAEIALAIRVLTEHLEIRITVRKLERAELELGELVRVGTLIQRHVRFEERVLFPLIESRLSEEELGGLGEEIAEAEGEGPCMP